MHGPQVAIALKQALRALRFPSQVLYDLLSGLRLKKSTKFVSFRMENLRSFIDQSMHAQLQQATRFQIHISLLTALVVFSGLQIVGRTRATSTVAPTPTPEKTLKKSSSPESIPPLTSIFNILNRALNTAYVRICVGSPIQWRHLFHRARGKPSDDTYATPRAEAKYWRVAGRYRLRLYSGNGTTLAPSVPSTASRDTAITPLVTYYTPRLLPLYRRHSTDKHTSREADVDAQDGRISPKTFCKWHRMVFQDSCHPTHAQAAVQMKYYSNRDLLEIQRIARLLPDKLVFSPKWRGSRKAKQVLKYSKMWGNWLEAKGVDLVIIFE